MTQRSRLTTEAGAPVTDNQRVAERVDDRVAEPVVEPVAALR